MIAATPSATPARRGPSALPTLFIGVLVTLFAWGTAGRVEQRALDAAFHADAAMVETALRLRIRDYFSLLDNLATLFADGERPTRRGFQRYVESLDRSGQYGGLVSVQYAPWIPHADRTAFLAAVRQDTSVNPRGYPDYTIYPPGERAAYLPVLYDVPVFGVATAFGFDPLADPTRREGIEYARDSGKTAISQPLPLVQAPGEPGVVLRHSIYGASAGLADPAARRAAFNGQLSLAVRTEAMFGTIAPAALLRRMHVAVSDGGLRDNATTLFDSARLPNGVLPARQDADADDRVEAHIAADGRDWVLRITRPARNPWLQTVPLLMLGGGIVTSLLLFALFLSLARRHALSQTLTAGMAESVRDSDARFRAVFEGAHEAIITIDQRGSMTAVNPATERLFGYPAGELLGRNVSMLMPEPDRSAHDGYLARHQTTGERRIIGIGREVSGRRRDGVCFPLDLAVTETMIGGARHYIGVLRDNTDRHDAERAQRALNDGLKQAVDERTRELTDANRELEYFAYTIAHDLRTPARHLAGYASLLAEELDGRLDDAQTTLVGNIVRAATRQGRLLDELLTYARIGHSGARTSALDLGELAAELRDELTEADPHARHIDWRIGTLPRVTADATLMRLVLQNLFVNAVKFTRGTAQPVIALSASVEGRTATFCVADNGAGFDMAHAGKLFRIFQRLHTEQEFPGSGIGLAIVRRAIDKHGGRVWAEGGPGRGARFYFTLNLAEKQE